MRPERIPLFPLNVVLFPGEDLPLHIFEPRYKHMVKRCVEEKTEFGMLLSLPKGIVRVGCTAGVETVIKAYKDGRMDIVAVGRVPFRIVELVQGEAFVDNPLLEGQVDYLEDRERSIDARTQRELIELFEVCHTLVFGDYPRNFQIEEHEGLSYLVAATLPMDLLWKQQILELRCEADRQERLLTHLREWAPHLEKTGALRQRAGGNGQALN